MISTGGAVSIRVGIFINIMNFISPIATTIIIILITTIHSFSYSKHCFCIIPNWFGLIKNWDSLIDYPECLTSPV